MLDPGGFQIGFEVEIRARHCRLIGGNAFMQRIAKLLPEPRINPFTGQRGGRYLCAFRFCPESEICFDVAA
jgi:hypothetical protein